MSFAEKGKWKVTFGGQTTTDDVLEDMDLSGVTALVTGASGGLGEETARALASKGAAVTIAARNVAKAEDAAVRIRESTGNTSVDVLEVDLSVPLSVRTAAANYNGSLRRLNILINNAGVMACPLQRTSEGWEMQFATNHLGHFLFTCLLTPSLLAGAPGRIVNLTSAGHKISDVDLDDPHYERRDYDKWGAYGQSKTANVLFSVELNKRLADAGITANAVHPGGIRTELGRHLSEDDIEALTSRVESDGGFEFKSIPEGAATSVWAATWPELEGVGGQYMEDCHIAEVSDGAFGGNGVAPYALDAASATQLWVLSEETLGEKFALSS